jgi:hypothetical protein
MKNKLMVGKKLTSKEFNKGGKIFIQLSLSTLQTSHPDFHNGESPLALLSLKRKC